MNRIVFFVIPLILVTLACSSTGNGENEGSSEATQEVSNVPVEKPTLPDIEVGDCSASAGPRVNFAKCDLTELNFSGTDFSGANLAQAILSNSNFADVNFTNANLAGVFASETSLLNANFTNADLTNADMSESNLINADFTGAITVGIDFSGSNMTDALITDEQLAQAFSVKGTVLPDGTFGK